MTEGPKRSDYPGPRTGDEAVDERLDLDDVARSPRSPLPLSALDLVCRRAAAEAFVACPSPSASPAKPTSEKEQRKLVGRALRSHNGKEDLERSLALGRLALVLSSASPTLREEFSPLFVSASEAASTKRALGDALIEACREAGNVVTGGTVADSLVDRCRALVGAGADPEFSTRHGDTPLTVACSSGCPELVEFLLSECLCDPDGNDGACTPPLHAAIEGAHVDCYGKAWTRHGECALLLLRAGADPCARDVPPGKVEEVKRTEGGDLNQHWSALHRAALRGLPDVCAMLLGKDEEGDGGGGGDGDGDKSDEQTKRSRRRRFVSDPDVLGPCDQTPLDLALYRRHAAVVEVLRAAGAKERRRSWRGVVERRANDGNSLPSRLGCVIS